MTAYPRSPVTGVTPWIGQNISGAQKWSGELRFLPGHWALGVQKLGQVRFHLRAWLRRANTPGPLTAGAPRGSPYPIPTDFLKPVGTAPCGRPKAFPLPGGRCPRRGRMRVDSGIAARPAGRENVRPLRIGGIVFVNRRGGTLGRPPQFTAYLFHLQGNPKILHRSGRFEPEWIR